MKTMAEDMAYSQLFGLTPLELSRHLLGAANLPSEVIESLNECNPELMSTTMASTYSARIVGVADFSCRLASLALDGGNNVTKFDDLSSELAKQFEALLPGVGTSIDSILLHADERIGSYTQNDGAASVPTPSLQRIRARVLHKNPGVLPSPAGKAKPAKAAAPTTTSTAPIVAAHIAQNAENSGATGKTVPPLGVPVTAKAGDSTSPANWAEQLTQTKAFETQAATPAPEVDHWSATLTFVRDSFGAQESWLFVAPPGGESFSITHGVGESWQEFRACAAVRADERTVFGICLARRENVVIHDTAEPTIATYMPTWFRQTKGAPGAFILMPLQTDGHIQGLVLIGWTLPHRLTITAAQTDLARQLFASANANFRKPTSSPRRAA